MKHVILVLRMMDELTDPNDAAESYAESLRTSEGVDLVVGFPADDTLADRILTHVQSGPAGI